MVTVIQINSSLLLFMFYSGCVDAFGYTQYHSCMLFQYVPLHIKKITALFMCTTGLASILCDTPHENAQGSICVINSSIHRMSNNEMFTFYRSIVSDLYLSRLLQLLLYFVHEVGYLTVTTNCVY